MATARLIARSLSTSEKRARLHEVAGPLAEFCQAMYPLIVAHSDDYGRVEGSVFHVKHAIEPTSPRTLTEFEAALCALMVVGLVDWYADSKNRLVLQVIDFKPHQPGLKQRPSKLEEFSELARRVVPRSAVMSTAIAPDSIRNDSIQLDSIRNETNKNSGEDAATDNYAVILKIAHEVLEAFPRAEYGDWIEGVKARCAQLKISYPGDVTRRAVDAAEATRKKRKAS